MKNGARKALLPLGDICMLLVAFFVMLYVSFPRDMLVEAIDSHLPPFLVIFGVWVMVFFLFNLYDAQAVKPTIPNLQKIGAAYVVALAASIILFYTISYFGITPKTNLLIFSVIFIILFIGWRRFFYKIFSLYFRKSVAFVIHPDDSLSSNELLNYMENYPQSGFLVLGKYSSTEELQKNQKLSQIDTLVVSQKALHDSPDIGIIYNKIKEIFDIAYAYEEILGKIPVDSVDEAWLLHNIRSTNKALYEAFTQISNIFISLILLLLTFPLMLIAALFIKLEDGGPVFFTQEKIGKKGRIFHIYKLRSMIVGADKNGAQWTEKNDPRITKIGRIIRKLHVDELPQLFNIMKGEMALVGPRPEIPSFADKLDKEIPHYNLRHIIIPGFTGWAQIKFRNARGVAESKEKFEYDLYYIKNRNIFMDIGIILRTVIIIFTHD